MAVFTVVPDKGFTKQTTPRILVSQFGDGYAHRTKDGINNINITWAVNFSVRDLSEVSDIVSFFETHGGVTPFDFTPPDENIVYKVICPEWSQTYDASIARSVSAKFVRVFQV